MSDDETEAAAPDAKLEELLGSHSAALLAYVAGVREELSSEIVAARTDEEDNDAEKESLLKRNTELAAILGATQTTAQEQEVRCRGRGGGACKR